MRLGVAKIVQRMVAFPDHQAALAPLVLEAMKKETQGKIFAVLCQLSAATSPEIVGRINRHINLVGTTLIDLENKGLAKRLSTDSRIITWGLAMPWVFLEPDMTHPARRKKIFKTCINNFRRGPENFASWYKNVEYLFSIGQLPDPPIPAYEVFPQLIRHDYGFFEAAFPGTNAERWAKEWMGEQRNETD